MVIALWTGLLVPGGLFTGTGLLICAEYRWVSRVEYLMRLRTRNWDDYWPIVVPPQVNEELY